MLFILRMSDDENDYYSDEQSVESSLDEPIIKKTIIKSNTLQKSKNFEDDYGEGEDDEEPDVDDEVLEDEEDEIDEYEGGDGDELDDLDDVDEEDEEDDEDDEDDENNEKGLNSSKNVDKKSSTKLKNKKKPIRIEIASDDDEDEIDEDYLQKFDSEITKNYVSEFHPECLNHNYDEISALTKVTRNSSNIIIDPLHRTIPYLTKYERARILGQRAKQIETGAKPLVKIPENIIDSYIIAELELEQKRIPFIIRRPIPGGGCEYWNLRDLELIIF